MKAFVYEAIYLSYKKITKFSDEFIEEILDSSSSKDEQKQQ